MLADVTRMDSENSAAAPDTTITCASCNACCCRLEVMIMGEDDIPLELTVEDRWGGRIMARLDDGWCAALDRDTKRCRIYERRPAVCRDYQVGANDCIADRAAAMPSARPAGKLGSKKAP